MLIWTHFFCQPQESQGGHIFICILHSLLPAAAVNPHHLRTCLCILNNEDPECWEPCELLCHLNLEKKIELSHTPQVENPVHVIQFLHCNKGNKMKPYRGLNGDVLFTFHCIQWTQRAPASC